ncbi:hypothetical protein [Bacillus sp. 1P06AnD]|uniref:hypothetical protein n=1 Tax=Bacillus sp. 1P06AnD TaxID=3132208 RepID=UPI00399F7933
MANNIFVLDKQNNLIEMKEESYDTEDIFQELIERYPTILAGDQINPIDPRKWILVSRERGVPSEMNGSNQWYLDHLFIDQDAIPTFVEIKRATDTRIRREVVAQMLDYAANATAYWELNTLKECYEAQLENGNTLSLEALGINVEKTDIFWDNVFTHLKVGKIRLMFVADEIPLSLQRILEFLNEQMTETEVLGLEIKQYVSSDGLKTLVPNLLGRTSKIVQTKRPEKGTWDEIRFFEDVQTVSGEQGVEVSRRLLRGFEKMGCRIWWGKGRFHGSFLPVYDGHLASHQLCSVYQSDKTTLIELEFQYYKEPFKTIEEKQILKQKFEKIPGLLIDEGRLNKRPSFDFSLLLDETYLNAFLEIFRGYIEAVQEHESRFETI